MKEDAKGLNVAMTPGGSQSTQPGDPDRASSSRDVVRDTRRAKVVRGLFKRPSVSRFGRYAVLKELGRGGMGAVLEAYDEELGRKVALKLLHRYQDEHAKRLRREAQALAQLSHPNVVQVFEGGQIDGQPYVALELVGGPTLSQWQSQSPRPGWRRCVEVYLGAGRGLAAAHAAGLVHRDFKPSNCIVDGEGRARVLDFGLVMREENTTTQELVPMGLPVEPRDDALGSSLTKTGATMGTPAYMPLEQIEGRALDALSDQFSFCVSLYEAVYAERPFAGTSMATIAASIASKRIQPAPRGTRVPARLRKILLRGLATEAEQRWPSMDALLDALERVVTPRWRRRRLLGFAALGMGLGVAGTGLIYQAAMASREGGVPCTGVEQPLAGIWDEARRREVERAILSTGHSHAADTWARVESRLTEYGRGWLTKHTEVCEATRVHETQSEQDMGLRMRCLSGRRVALRKVVDLLAQVDASMLDQAAPLPSNLPDLSRCDDLEALQAAVPGPEAPWMAEEVEVVREQLMEVRVLREAGQLRRALGQAESSVEHATLLGHGPLEAEARLERGEARDAMSLHAEAAEDLERARLLALEHDHRGVEVRATSALLWVMGRREASPEQRQALARTALALSERRDTEGWVRAGVLGNVGVMLLQQGDLDGALERLEQALATRKATQGPDHPKVADTHNELGNTLLSGGRLEEARAHFDAALAIQGEVLGPDHPGLARSLGNVGRLLMRQGHLDEALVYFHRALDIQREALRPTHRDLIATLGNIGLVLEQKGELNAALALHRMVLAKQQAALASDSADVARTEGNIAVVLHRRGALDEALGHYRRALDGFQAQLGSRHPLVARTLNNIGMILRQRGDPEGALVHHRQALGIYRAIAGSDHADVASVLGDIGFALLERGEPVAAFESFERALAILEGSPSNHASLRVHPLLGLARVGLQRGDLVDPARAAQQALDLHMASETVDPSLRAELQFVLARALWLDPAQRVRARALAEAARDQYTWMGTAAQGDLAEVEQWLVVDESTDPSPT